MKGKRPVLIDRATRRRILFAPIGVVYHGAKSWGGHTTIDEEVEKPQSTRGEYVREFRRRSGLLGEDE